MALEMKLVAVVVIGLIVSVGGFMGIGPDEPEVDPNAPVSRVMPTKGLYYLWTEPLPPVHALGENAPYETDLLLEEPDVTPHETGLLFEEPGLTPNLDVEVLTNGDGIVMHWAGTDGAGTGIAHYDVQVKIGDDGDWEDWRVMTTDTDAMYYPADAGTYYFRCRATDQVGNVEGYPETPDAQFKVKVIKPGDIIPRPDWDHEDPDLPDDPYWWYCPPGMVCALDEDDH